MRELVTAIELHSTPECSAVSSAHGTDSPCGLCMYESEFVLLALPVQAVYLDLSEFVCGVVGAPRMERMEQMCASSVRLEFELGSAH
jgi:hypothetical protein